jgi:hypothetical protein
MPSHFPAEQWERIASFLAHQRIGVISVASSPDVWAMPVWYRHNPGFSGSRSLEVDCLVPHWADIAHQLTRHRRVVVIIQASSGAGLGWLQIQGTAQPVEAPEWSRLLPRWVSDVQPDSIYLVVRVMPSRIDLIDEDLGWGVQETLEW